MASLNDLKFAALTNAGFSSGTLGDREYQWLAYHTSIESGMTLNDQWMYLLDILGYEVNSVLLETGDDLLLETGDSLLMEFTVSASLNTRQMYAWQELGHTGTTWNDLAVQFWTAGGEWIPAYVLLETGDHVLLETGDDLLLD